MPKRGRGGRRERYWRSRRFCGEASFGCSQDAAHGLAAEVVQALADEVQLGANRVGDGDDVHADLVGLEVRDDTGTAIGKIVAVHNFGGGDILDVTLAGRKGGLIPFTQAAVPQVSIAEGFVRVDPAAAGLIEDEDGEAQGRDGFDPKGRPRGPKDAGGNR